MRKGAVHEPWNLQYCLHLYIEILNIIEKPYSSQK